MVGQYSIKLLAKYTGGNYSQFYSVVLVMVFDPCIDAIITINPLILPSLVIDYEVGSFIKSIQFDENFIRSSVPNCPDYKFKFVSLNGEGEELDPDVFA